MSRNLIRRAALAAALALSVSVLAACGGDSAGDSSASARLKAGTLNYPSSLDPTVSSSGYDYPHLNLVYSTLLEGNRETGVIEEGLAESWEVAEDGSSITLTIREGVTFQDGTELNAEAVKSSLERFKASANGNDIANVSSIKVSDGNVVTLQLSQPDSSILTALTDRAGMIVSPTAVEKEGEDFASRPVGAGPFTLASQETGSSVSYERFDDYWGEEAKSAEVTWTIYGDAQALVTGLQSGAVDLVIGVPATFVERLEETQGLSAVVGPAYSLTMINFNAGMSPTDDERIRQAINLALDREAINKAGSGDVAELAWTALPPMHPYFDESLVPTYEHDVAKAKSLVDEATGGERVDMKCLTFPGLNYETTGPIIIDQLAQIGIDVEIQSETAPAATESFWVKSGAPCFLSGWTGHADPAITYGRLLDEESFYNAGKTDFGTNELRDALLSTYDFDEKKAATTALEQAVVEAAPFAPLFTVPQIVAMSDDVNGYEPNASGRPDLSTVYLK